MVDAAAIIRDTNAKSSFGLFTSCMFQLANLQLQKYAAKQAINKRKTAHNAVKYHC